MENSIISLVISSSLGSAIANIVWNWYVHHSDRKDKERSVDHKYLSLYESLSEFIVMCSIQIESIDHCFVNSEVNCDDSYFEKLNDVTISLLPEESWHEISVSIAQKIKKLIKNFSRTDRWIYKKSKEEDWMDTDELYELETQRLSFYAIEAYKIRDAIESISSIEKDDISAHKKLFLQKIDACNNAYTNDPSGKLVIPELKKYFEGSVD